MKDLRSYIEGARAGHEAIGHFNISDLTALRAIFDAAREAGLPIIIGTSEGEREWIGAKQAVALVRSLRAEYDFPIFINADHTHSFAKVREAAEAGYDSIIADFSKMSLEENIAETKKAAEYVHSLHPEILVEGELGYIGGPSEVFTAIPEGAAISPADLTRPEDAARFVKETGVDLFSPAVGNIHGMFADAPSPRLDIGRIEALTLAAGVPLVLHGGSGIADEDFRAAIAKGISIVHINTEIRRAWREGMEKGFRENASVAPYKLMSPAYEAVKATVSSRMKLFAGR